MKIGAATWLRSGLRLPPWRRYWRAWLLLGVTVALWSAFAWLAIGRYEGRLADSYLRRERMAAERDLRMVAIGIAQNLEVTEGVLSGLARQDDVIAALNYTNGGQTGGPGSYAADSQLRAISRSFYGIVGELKIIGTVFLLNDKGDCIAASNGIILTSPVGTNYADRNYFITARLGSRSTEFVFGRATNQPGLYLALPVRHEGVVAGVIVAKLDASTLAPWLTASDFFIADENGVIMLARDDEMQFKLLPGNKIEQIPLPDRMALYKRSSFSALPSDTEIVAGRPEILMLPDHATPVMLVTVPLAISGAVAGVMHSLPRLPLFEHDQWQFFVPAALAGAMLQLAFFVVVLPLRENLRKRRNAEQRLAFHQSMIDAAELAIAVFGEDGYCLTANDTMARMLGTPRALMYEHNFRFNELWMESGMVGTADQVFAMGVAQRGHWRLKPALAQEIWVEATMKRFTYRSRNYLLVIFTDVTEQHWRESLLNEI
jgi:C4-dicarboxylate-specific signal transduction histidine kinase